MFSFNFNFQTTYTGTVAHSNSFTMTFTVHVSVGSDLSHHAHVKLENGACGDVPLGSLSLRIFCKDNLEIAFIYHTHM